MPHLQQLAAQAAMGRLNVMRSDMAYAALYGEDEVPSRRHLFHVSDMPTGTSPHQLQTAAAQLNLGWPRVKLEVRSS